MSFYDINVKDKKGEMVSLSEYKGKVILVINSATGCGFTPQYNELERLYETYKDRGFIILDFPCDQFGHQAPGSDEEISEFCQMKFGVKFPQFAKIEVNGKNAAEVFKFLKSQKGFGGFDKDHKHFAVLDDMLRKVDSEYEKNPDIKWNFTKFLLDKDGKVVARFEPTAGANKIEECLKTLL
ncbi:glutathione peroxidase [Campylobacter sp. faydin G-105]|uniref:glutathione peroxidase n=1 Tax=Campylobacter anatolicus TaxID=2829105 RepID=UPI001B8EBB40|nr:glutathione peroxidase [Campylobacter anatolicus]MBR8461601.1 glutathione peroxidase [Campylobacter anatolicus]